MGQAGGIVGVSVVATQLWFNPQYKRMEPFWQAAYLVLGLGAGGFSGMWIGSCFPIPFSCILLYVSASAIKMELDRKEEAGNNLLEGNSTGEEQTEAIQEADSAVAEEQ